MLEGLLLLLIVSPLLIGPILLVVIPIADDIKATKRMKDVQAARERVEGKVIRNANDEYNSMLLDQKLRIQQEIRIQETLKGEQ